jgi:oxygen-dependent protoporphyrinogen oxidase
MQTLIDRLREDLGGGVLCSGKRLNHLVQKPRGWEMKFADGSCEQADLLCLAVTAPAAARLAEPFSCRLSEALRRTPYEDAVTVNLAFKASDCGSLPRGAGFVIPKLEGLPLVGVTLSHQKFDGRVPSDGVLIRAFIGGVYHREVLKYNDAQLETLACETVRKLLRIEAEPLWMSLIRYPEAMPQFLVGHCKHADFLREQIKAIPGFFLTGNYFSGVGIPDCVHEAEKTAGNVLNYFKNNF